MAAQRRCPRSSRAPATPILLCCGAEPLVSIGTPQPVGLPAVWYPDTWRIGLLHRVKNLLIFLMVKVMG